jgi:predicted membrane-bound mannosyltransferase
MSARQTPTSDDWQLGPEPKTDEPVQLTVLKEPEPDLSAGRLERPLHTITIEHLAWTAVAVWALFSRCATLGACPLATTEARHALFEYDLANATRYAASAGYHPAWSGWIHLGEAGLFAVGGADDLGARLLFVISGLLMVAVAFAFRDEIGRAGAIALAALIAVSPTFTWFSRTSATGLPAAAMAMVTLVAFARLRRRPTFGRAMGLGCAGGLMAAADPAGLIVGGIFVIALALLGAYELVFSAGAFLRARVWIARYATLPHRSDDLEAEQFPGFYSGSALLCAGYGAL